MWTRMKHILGNKGWCGELRISDVGAAAGEKGLEGPDDGG